MKKITFLLLAFHLGSMMGHAQDQRPDYEAYRSKPFFSEIELYAGPSLSFLRGGAEIDSYSPNPKDLKFGFTVGLGLSHLINEGIETKGMLLFERKGGVINHNTEYFDESTQAMKNGRLRDEFIYDGYTLPILATYGFGKTDRFRVGVGPFASYLRKQTKRSSYDYSNSSSTVDETQYNKKLEWGLACDLSCRIPVGSKMWLKMEVLNTLGLSNTRSISYIDNKTIKINNTSLLIGVILKR